MDAVVRRSVLPLAFALVAVGLTVPTAQAATAPKAPADHLVVRAGWAKSTVVEGDVVSGGIALLDDAGSFDTASVAGSATLPGASLTLDVRKQTAGFGGRFTLDAGAVRISATTTLGVDRIDDDTVTWNGFGTVTRGTKQTQEPVSVTLDDRLLDPGNHAVHLTHAGQERDAVVRVPAGAGGVQGLPALFHFPGLGETPFIANFYDKLDPAADRHGYLLVTPAHYGVGWQGVQAGTPGADVDDPGYVRALADVVRTRFGADRTRLYASGMSNGGFFTNLVACRLADVFAAFAPVAGQLNDPATCQPSRPVPLVTFHGDADPLVLYSTVAPAVAFWAKNNGCAAAPVETRLPDLDPNDGTRVIRYDYPGCTGAPLVLYRIVGGGHAWPGGDPYPVPPLGKASKDVDANEAIWAFVSSFRLPAA